MLRDTDCFTILKFGYESILPELAQRQHDIHAQETMGIIRRAPDFAVINNKTHDVHLIEVKYMMNPETKWVLPSAERMYQSWKPSYLFLITPNGFYFDKASTIVENQGVVSPLNHPDIPKSLQDKYIKILNEFIVPHTQVIEDIL